MDNKVRIESIIKIVQEKCLSWLKIDENGSVIFEDPNDGEEISAHYGATHAAAAFIIRGSEIGDKILYDSGISLLKSILERWYESKKLVAFHFDFNNFALCASLPYIKDIELAKFIKKTVLSTSDSNNPTTNWIPMRWYVNLCRKEWTGDEKYQRVIDQCKSEIKAATNSDGGVEDRLPKGISFNLQYDASTVGVLQYISCRGYQINLSKELGFLLNAVAPDGDVNYQGRGTNQIFAWSCWLYLLASAGKEIPLAEGLNFVEYRLHKMLVNNNIMLNAWEGKEKYLWWDYHYASVYIAHFLFWMVLAQIDYGKKTIQEDFVEDGSTGLRIHKGNGLFVSIFDGRNEYLAEKGPVVSCLWTKNKGIISKGTFAPWQGAFGNKYIYEDIVIKNFMGLLRVARNKDWSKNRYVHKLLPTIESDPSLCLSPIFCPIKIHEGDGELEVVWKNKFDGELLLNIPSFIKNLEAEILIDGMPIQLSCVSAFRNQYDWVWIHQTHSFKGHEIKLKIKV